MASVWVDGTAGLALHCHLHLMCAPQGHDISREKRAIVFDDYERLIAMFFVDRNGFKAVSILLKDKAVGAFSNDWVRAT